MERFKPIKNEIMNWFFQMKSKPCPEGKPLRDSSESDQLKSCITYHYSKNEKKKENNIIDSIMDYICKLNSTKYLVFSNKYKPNNIEPFSLNYKDVMCKIRSRKFSDQQLLDSFTFDIYSNTLELKELQKWIESITIKYEIYQNNQLGEHKYFFREIYQEPPSRIDSKGNKFYDLKQAPKKISFSMTKFETTKSFSNIFGKEVRIIKDRLDIFMGNSSPGFYDRIGMPRTLGLLLHGDPGTGKTSTIKAIANDCKKHIISVRLSEFSTQDQFNNLFYSDTIEVVDDKKTTLYKIPLDERIYVLEDIDCLGDVVHDRKYKQQKQMAEAANQYLMSPSKKDDDRNSNKISLNYLLNLFDGILETPGRLLIMTSNYPEMLDKALIRPGRIDLNIKFTNATTETLNEMFEFFYLKDKNENSKEIKERYIFTEEFNQVFTPAEIIQVFSLNYNSYRDAFLDLNIMLQEKYKKMEQERLQRIEDEKVRKLAEEENRNQQNKEIQLIQQQQAPQSIPMRGSKIIIK